jgi:hypothetical protein
MSFCENLRNLGMLDLRVFCREESAAKGSGERVGKRASFNSVALFIRLIRGFLENLFLLSVTSVASVVKTKAEKIVRILLEPCRGNQIQAS